MKFFLPKQPAFANYFKELNLCIKEIAQVFSDFLSEFNQIEKFAQKAEEIENRADNITHTIILELNQTFITPFDREDIYALAHEMDDIVDLIENAIHNIEIYGITEKKPVINDFGKLIIEAAAILEELFTECFAKQKYTEKINELIVKLHQLEDQADEVFQTELKTLFKEEKDPITIIKWKDLLENLEEIMDEFQQISNTIEGIVVKSS